MDYDRFDSIMSDILSSGQGTIEISPDNWYGKNLKSLFDEVEDKDILLDYVNTYYGNVEAMYIVEGELPTISELLGKTVEVTIEFS